MPLIEVYCIGKSQSYKYPIDDKSKMENLFPFSKKHTKQLRAYLRINDAFYLARKQGGQTPVFTLLVDPDLINDKTIIKDEYYEKEWDSYSGYSYIKLDVNKIDRISHGTVEIISSKEVYSFGQSTKCYEDAWNKTNKSIEERIIAVLQQYKGGNFGLFRSHKPIAEEIISMIRNGEKLENVLAAIKNIKGTQSVESFLKGDLCAALSVIIANTPNLIKEQKQKPTVQLVNSEVQKKLENENNAFFGL